MSGLFGNVGTAAATTAATNTTGDISKDVALNSPPEDSISDLAFSPVSNHLAYDVSSGKANDCRMEQKSSVSEQIKLRAYWT